MTKMGQLIKHVAFTMGALWNLDINTRTAQQLHMFNEMNSI